MSIGGIAAESLRQFIERVERLEEEKQALQADIKDVLSQAKSQGFDTKIIRKIVALRRQDPEERREESQLLELYMAAIGMGDGPLSDSTRDRLSKPKGDDNEPGLPLEPPPDPEPPAPDITIEQARILGQQAALAGKPVSANPFPAGDPRRGAWDEEWCRAAGSDGMEIPKAWQRKKKPKKDKDSEKKD